MNKHLARNSRWCGVRPLTVLAVATVSAMWLLWFVFPLSPPLPVATPPADVDPFQFRVVLLVGTRPEVVKMAPLYHSLMAAAARPLSTEDSRQTMQVFLVNTGQHQKMAGPLLEFFGMVPDIDLALMTPNQTLSGLTAAVISAMQTKVLSRVRPHLVLVQGDTTSAAAAAMAAFYNKIPIGHVEAGLRTNRLDAPFPEEFNRRVIGGIASLHFAPTQHAASHLLAEGIDSTRVWVTGNTVIDAVLQSLPRPLSAQAARDFEATDIPRHCARHHHLSSFCSVVLVTAHRREAHGGPLEAICRAVRRLALAHPDTLFVFPVHLNPNVRNTVTKTIGSHPNINLINPLDYPTFVHVLNASHLVLTDSGGIQEEASALGVPVLIMREATERMEGVNAGVAKLVGMDEHNIVEAAEALMLPNSPEWRKMALQHTFPYGKGDAAQTITNIILQHRTLLMQDVGKKTNIVFTDTVSL